MSLSQKQKDIQMMLAAQCHVGAKNLNFQMERYVHKRREDGSYVFDLGKTWDKLQLAARIIVAIENPKDVVVLSARPYGQRGVLKFANQTGAEAMAGRYTPGTFTNQIQKVFKEPRLLVLTDPMTDHQPITETSYVSVPTIAFCDADSALPHVDVAIPANNKGKHSIGVLYYILARMVCQMRGTLEQGKELPIVVDLFFYKDPEEAEEEAVAEETFETQAGGEGGFGDGGFESGGFESGGFEGGAAAAQPQVEYMGAGQFGSNY